MVGSKRTFAWNSSRTRVIDRKLVRAAAGTLATMTDHPAPHLEQRRRRYAASLDPADTLILIAAGDFLHVPGGLDQTYPFRAHPDYYALAEQECPGAVLAYDPADDPAHAWAHFAPPVTPAQRIWEGDVTWQGAPISELAAWLAARRGRPIAMLGAPLPGLTPDPAQTALMKDRYAAARRIKDDAELSLIREAARITAAAFALAPDLCRPGATERQIQIELDSAMLRAGADRTAYDTIVGIGPNAAVFHSRPGTRVAAPADCVLIDAGAEVSRYAADVTRTYPASGRFSQAQSEIHQAVLAAQSAAIAAARPGVEWHDVHRAAAESMAAELTAVGMLKGDPAELVDRGVIALFFPHGVGHMVGLGVRDAGGSLATRPPRKGPGGTAIRVDLPLAENMVVTVEPGCYFVPALIDNPETRSKFDGAIHWPTVDRLRAEIQGVRIEDNICVKRAGAENLTAAIEKPNPARQ